MYPTSNKRAANKLKQSVSNEQKVEVKNNKSYLYCKRVIDFTFSLFGMIVLCPVFIMLALFIKLENRHGAIFFKQTRVGKDGKQFSMYKFRSMVPDAEQLKLTLFERNEATGPVFKIKQDPRVTNIGRFMRKTSLDELPQLFNVIKGDMSLVGPRPPIPEEVAQYTSYEWQRLSVKPGLTCYWQVSGRSNIEFSEWMKLDIDYINDRNTWVDLKLIIKTIIVLFGSRGAY